MEGNNDFYVGNERVKRVCDLVKGDIFHFTLFDPPMRVLRVESRYIQYAYIQPYSGYSRTGHKQVGKNSRQIIYYKGRNI